MISVYYLTGGEDHFSLDEKQSEVTRFINQDKCPSRIVVSGFELTIISNWKNIPITNNLACTWCGDMAWFIVMNLVATMREQEKRQANY